jgi:hypothetical protein
MKKPLIGTALTAGAFVATLLYLGSREDGAEPPPPPAAPTEKVQLAQMGYVQEASLEVRNPPPPAEPRKPQPAQDAALPKEHVLTPFVQGIQNVAPLSPEQERAVLGAKLRHKKIFEAALRDSGLDRPQLSAAEREYAHALVRQAMTDYRNNYLMEARSALTEDQYILLRDYETTELDNELASLQQQINAR